MGQVIGLYLVTAVVFLGLDAIGITRMIQPLFARHIGHLFADPLRVVPAALFYLGYVAGVIYLVSLPALRAGAPMQALISGLILGLLAYGTYEFTNYATLQDWHWHQVAVDLTWGTLLTGFSAWVGVAVFSGKLA
ncbi:DUF2177 family protein [Ketogulonicigenium vulgare]|uniref:DUF2177 family protein n=1 Tax=Ketogulonicigenium vulgare TaxID=92945 RepID=UPI0001E67B5C|nr:DUF2177 family protein [Ketogulonicigenium vulgare]ADO42728.1 membrane protein-like protein [Ketogulonicigenium vulgare Y25]ALJ81072.1 hypothetical protein KVH_07715 [Ketogulonicigenium vulgare]ANW33827.1 hypothetical protein KvSKV_07680 [Ketogulonicigenium vulgare]AOZ54640.1 membrane protein-like protein [Ketogulonicigenium vulgare]